MTFTLPLALQNPDDTAARTLLEDYYGPTRVRGGATFDSWDSLGSRAADTNRFTADDIVAVSFLSVQVPPLAARQLLLDRAADFARMLVRKSSRYRGVERHVELGAGVEAAGRGSGCAVTARLQTAQRA
jgi:Family of unknown function (DUF6308)